MELCVFRFQIGTIKSSILPIDLDFSEVFRFQIGTIKSLLLIRLLLKYFPRFDSKLVRLKETVDHRFLQKSVFRFQIGTIKRYLLHKS